MAMYESDHTKFIREWMAKHPQEIEEQRKGRALWWDKPQKLAVLEEHEAANVPTKAYYYQSDV